MPARRGGVDDARLVAFRVLEAVDTRDAYANLVLPFELRTQGLSGRDAAFATELSHGTLRRQGGYDQVLSSLVNRPLDTLDAAVLTVLRLGVHQILGMRVPVHAAVATSVDLARRVAGVGPSKFVNAVLRKVATRDLDGWLRELAPKYDADPISHLAVTHFHPDWVVEAFNQSFGGSMEDTAALLAADNAPPRVTLAAWPGRSTVAELGGTPARWSPYAVELAEGDPGLVPAVAEGRAGVQDEGSQLVALALARATVLQDGPWLDLCAGPGGKAALLAGLVGEAQDTSDGGQRLVAVERQPHRAELVRRALGDAPGALGVVRADGTAPPFEPGRFSRVLVDAPCTGLGALRRRPEARWRRDPADLQELCALQRALLHSAVRLTRSGGIVAYVTCSPHLAETRSIVDGVGQDRDDVEEIDVRSLLEGVPDLGPGPSVQLWPHRHGTDAMFLAMFRRR